MSNAKRDREAFHRWLEQKWTIFRHDDFKRCRTRAEIVVACRQFKTALLIEGKNHWKFHAYIQEGIGFVDEIVRTLTSDQPKDVRRAALADEPRKPKIKIKLPKWMRGGKKNN